MREESFERSVKGKTVSEDGKLSERKVIPKPEEKPSFSDQINDS